jgi:hypothetical protein
MHEGVRRGGVSRTCFVGCVRELRLSPLRFRLDGARAQALVEGIVSFVEGHCGMSGSFGDACVMIGQPR